MHQLPDGSRVVQPPIKDKGQRLYVLMSTRLQVNYGPWRLLDERRKEWWRQAADEYEAMTPLEQR